jgi:hypothetical protein
MQIVIIGAKERAEKLRRIKEMIPKELKVALVESGIVLQEEVKDSILGNRAEPRSFKTGYFYNSIKSEPVIDGVKVSSDANYAKFLEYGTARIDERRHFRNSMSRVAPIIKDKTKEIIKKLLK